MQQVLHRALHREGWTYAGIEKASGVKTRALQSYLLEGKEPSFSSASSIACVLGGWAVNMLLAPIGYTATPLDEADAIEPQKVVADCLTQFATIAHACADNRIDHTEAERVMMAADALIEKVTPLSSLAHAA